MIIHLNKSKLFKVEPGVRFGREYNVDHKLWNEIWKRYKFLDYPYTTQELCEYFLIRTKREIKPESIRRWILMTEIYSKAQPVMKHGAQTVVSSFFNEYESDVIFELTRNMRFSQAKDSRNIV